MRIGILADIHEHVEPLQRALDEFRRRAVDLVVTLGDTCDVFFSQSRAAETVALLKQTRAMGVWGNHDVNLCHAITELALQRYSAEVFAFMAGMQGHLSIGDCLFSHVEPWLNPYDPLQLWYYDGLPDTPEKAGRTFQAVPHRFVFVGHFHRWLAMTPSGRLDWDASRPIVLDGDARYLVAIAATFAGHCAVFDTERRELTPLRV